MWEKIGFLLWTWETLEEVRDRGWPNDLAALGCWSDSDIPPLPEGFYMVDRSIKKSTASERQKRKS
jgi:hypothetical protein